MSSTSLLCKGYVREDGYVFKHYQKRGDKVYENWASPEAYHKSRIYQCWRSAKLRAQENNIPFSIDADYLSEIFPSDMRCPVTGNVLEWGVNNLNNSPSLDRIEPHKGYIPGNLCWISYRANTLKRDAKLHEMEMLVAYMKNPPVHGKEKAH